MTDQIVHIQMSYWMDKGVLSLQGLVGCFAMTEMRGVRALENCDSRRRTPC